MNRNILATTFPMGHPTSRTKHACYSCIVLVYLSFVVLGTLNVSQPPDNKSGALA